MGTMCLPAGHGRAWAGQHPEFGRSAGYRRNSILSTDTELSESDAELIARLQRGDQTAFTTLVRRWEGPLVRIAYRIIGELAEAEDVRQRVLLKLLETSGAVREPERFAAWIHRAVVNAALERTPPPQAARGSEPPAQGARGDSRRVAPGRPPDRG